MTDVSNTDRSLSAVKRALLTIRDLRAQLAEIEQARHEPIAIVGMGMRFPGGVTNAAEFARLLWSGKDAVTPIPPDRWPLDAFYAADPDAPGKMTTRFGAFLDGIDLFDGEFFGVSPREAMSMDPQQRLLMEVAWEALEDAGHSPAELKGSSTGVYLGIANGDYGRALFAQPDLIDVYFSTGNAFSVAAGRLSYFLGLHGPSIAVDTACSSSLVALHLACQSLRQRECDLAMAGGVNLILTPEMNINFSKAGMMAADGRCKTFDAQADGYVRGEGCALVVLRRLGDALAEGNRILALVRGSAVNQDGRSGGLTAPNGPAQEAVVAAALKAACVPAHAVGYVEAHGTGTPLGDPIEIGAISATYGADRDHRQPLLVGSLKTNIGHLEAAAGIASVIKVVLALQRGEIPPHLNFSHGNPHIDWARVPIAIPRETVPWSPIDGRRVAGVSSFGFSGTNAHAIVEEAPAPELQISPCAERPLHILPLSALNHGSLLELARAYEVALSPALDVADASYTAGVGRKHFANRLAVIGARCEDMRRRLAEWIKQNEGAAGAAQCVRPRIAFLFTGQGAHYPGMGKRLYDTSLVFRQAIDRCAAELAPRLGRGLVDVLSARGQQSLDDPAYIQPALFSVEYALAELWRSWGVEPVAVLGHSLGEYAAACFAGTLSLQDALRVVTERGRLAATIGADGAMAAVSAPPEVVHEDVAGSAGSLHIAAYNGPQHVVVSGDTAAVDAACRRFESRGIRAKRLQVSYAAHSPAVEPLLPAFRRSLDDVHFARPRISVVSNVTGAIADDRFCTPDYWTAHLRQPVRFEQSMRTLAAQGITHFIEIGPHPVLSGMAMECLPETGLAWLPSLHRDRDDWCDLLEGVQRLYVDGVDINWRGFHHDVPRRRAALPTYRFRRNRYWIDVSKPAAPEPLSAERAWASINAALERQSEQGPLDLNPSSYPAKWDCLARVTSARVIDILRGAGLFASPGERRSLDDVLAVARVKPDFRDLVRRWLDRLVTQGLLCFDRGAYSAVVALPEQRDERLWLEAERLFSDNQELLRYVRHCSELLEAVIRGDESPLETLFPQGAFDLAEGLYERSTTMRYVNALAAAAVESLSRMVPQGRALRVLEVGAGTGSTTAALLPILDDARVQYCFTDVSDLFLSRGRERFASRTTMTYGRFDLDKDPAQQGWSAGAFHVVVSANAVHASSDLPQALRRLHRLLAPGGVLILIESTTHHAWFEITTGLIEGWRHFSDDLRADNPLLSADRWKDALRAADFAAVESWPKSGSPADQLGQHLIVARVAGDTALEAAGSESSVATAPAELRAQAEEPSGLTQRLLDALPADRLDLMREFVREQVMRVLRLDTAAPPGRHDRLVDLGFDSMMAVQLRNSISRNLQLDQRLPATLIFDHPTIDDIARYVLERVTAARASTRKLKQQPVEPPSVLGTSAVAALTDAEIEARLLERLGKS